MVVVVLVDDGRLLEEVDDEDDEDCVGRVDAVPGGAEVVLDGPGVFPEFARYSA